MKPPQNLKARCRRTDRPTKLRPYGADIFVADLVGLSMLREFAPLITAITIAGRSGSAYAAQIGTMAVTEEIDALHTIGIEPLELLMRPRVIALVVSLPLLTVFADVFGVLGDDHFQGMGTMLEFSHMRHASIRQFVDGPRGRAAWAQGQQEN